MRIRSILIGLFFAFANTATSIDTYCSNNYGAPKIDDCYTLLQTLPIGQDPQVFNEEQLQTPGTGWPGIINRFPRPVKQLPKYWSLS